MKTKIITKDCPSCKYLSIGEDTNFHCNWGHSKKSKILKDQCGNHPILKCNLIEKNKITN